MKPESDPTVCTTPDCDTVAEVATPDGAKCSECARNVAAALKREEQERDR
jgi:hypothetical protein